MTAEEIHQLDEALRGVLRIPKDDSPPLVDPDWRSRWSALADLGVAGFCVPEERDGFGYRVDAAVTAATALGAALHGAPFAGLTAAAYSLAHAGGPAASDLLDELLAGTAVCAFGVLPSGDDAVSTARTVDGLAHADALVLFDPARGRLVVSRDRSAWSLQAVRPEFDVDRSCDDVTLTGDVDADTVETSVDPRPVYRLLLAADALGGVQRSLERAVAYSGQRRAFGKVTGGFQAVQHRLVDHTVRARGMQLALAEAARACMTDPAEAARLVPIAELAVSGHSVRILHDLVQLTGGIGFTWEHGLHLFERRAHQDARLAGNPRSAARALAEVEGWTDAR